MPTLGFLMNHGWLQMHSLSARESCALQGAHHSTPLQCVLQSERGDEYDWWQQAALVFLGIKQ